MRLSCKGWFVISHLWRWELLQTGDCQVGNWHVNCQHFSFNCHVEAEGLFTFTIKAVISRKRCKIATLLLQITDRSQEVMIAYRVAPSSMTLSNFQGRGFIAALYNVLFRTVAHQVTRLTNDNTSRCPSAIAQLLVYYCKTQVKYAIDALLFQGHGCFGAIGCWRSSSRSVIWHNSDSGGSSWHKRYSWRS